MVTGLIELIASLEKMGRFSSEGGSDALVAVAEKIMDVAKARTPYATGKLQDSGRVDTPIIRDKIISVALSFGGEDAPYAVYVHENLGAQHQSPGQAKFLESAILESEAYFEKDIAYKMLQIWRTL